MFSRNLEEPGITDWSNPKNWPPTVKLPKTNKDRIYHSPLLTYRVLYDYAAGKKERYTVLIINVDDPVIIGRELDLTTIRYLIADYDSEANGWKAFRPGNRRSVLKLRDRVIAKFPIY